MQTQIENEKITRKTFELEYRTDLSLKNAVLTQLSIDKPIKGICEFTTSSKLPLIIDSSISGVLFSITGYYDFLNDPTGLIFRGQVGRLKPGEIHYINDISTFVQPVLSQDMYPSKEVYELMLRNKVTIVYFGKIVYENPANDKPRYLLYAVLLPANSEVPYFPNKTIQLIYMKNFDGN